MPTSQLSPAPSPRMYKLLPKPTSTRAAIVVLEIGFLAAAFFVVFLTVVFLAVFFVVAFLATFLATFFTVLLAFSVELLSGFFGR